MSSGPRTSGPQRSVASERPVTSAEAWAAAVDASRPRTATEMSSGAASRGPDAIRFGDHDALQEAARHRPAAAPREPARGARGPQGRGVPRAKRAARDDDGYRVHVDLSQDRPARFRHGD